MTSLSPAERSADLQKRQKFPEAKRVRERLKDLGFTPEEIRMRMSGLSDSQAHPLALHPDEIKGAGHGVAVFLVGFLIAVLIVRIIYASGHKIVLQ